MLWVAVGGCLPDPGDPADWPYVELEGLESGEVRRWAVPGPEAWPVGAGEEQLGPIAYDVRAISYRLRSSQHPALFLMGGDLAEGIPTGDGSRGAWWRPPSREFVQLPMPASFFEPVRYELPVSDPEFGQGIPEGVFYGSFRVYDQGDCSVMSPWYDVARGLTRALEVELARNPETVNTEMRRWGIVPRIRAAVDDPYRPEALGLPQDRPLDGLRVSWRFTTDLRPPQWYLPNCSDQTFLVELGVELERTGLAFAEVEAKELARRCFGLSGGPPGTADGLRLYAYTQLLLSAVERGQWRAALRACPEADDLPLPHFGEVPWEEIDEIRLRRDYSGNEADEGLLVGLSTFRDHDLGAHDVLLRVTEARVRHRGGCFYGGSAADALASSLRRGMVLGFWQGVRSQAVVDPALVDFFFLGAKFPERGPRDAVEPYIERTLNRACTSDLDCGPAEGVPAFAYVDPDSGEVRWAGARHVCRERTWSDRRELFRLLEDNPDAAQFYGQWFSTLQLGRVCQVAIEPDWVNVRPDGLEVVLVGAAEEHVQGAILAGAGVPSGYGISLTRFGACDVDDDGYLGDDRLFSLNGPPRPGAVPPGAAPVRGRVGREGGAGGSGRRP